MNDLRHEKLDDYYAEAQSWSADRQASEARARRIAWIIAGVLGTIALLEAIALILLVPLKREVPYTLLVDRQTGYVEALQPLETGTLTADAALTRSFLVQYVIARESFDAGSLQDNYRKIGLWSAGAVRDRYMAAMRASNPESPLASLPRGAEIDVAVRSVSSLAANRALVRFSTTRSDPGGRAGQAQHWAAVIDYGFTGAEMSAEDRITNPLGFQVTRYRKDPETLPIAVENEGLPEAEPIPSSMDGTAAAEAGE